MSQAVGSFVPGSSAGSRGGESWIEAGGGVGEEKVKDLGWATCMMGVWICAV